jgi:hypothetical protein
MSIEELTIWTFGQAKSSTEARGPGMLSMRSLAVTRTPV